MEAARTGIGRRLVAGMPRAAVSVSVSVIASADAIEGTKTKTKTSATSPTAIPTPAPANPPAARPTASTASRTPRTPSRATWSSPRTPRTPPTPSSRCPCDPAGRALAVGHDGIARAVHEGQGHALDLAPHLRPAPGSRCVGHCAVHDLGVLTGEVEGEEAALAVAVEEEIVDDEQLAQLLCAPARSRVGHDVRQGPCIHSRARTSRRAVRSPSFSFLRAFSSGRKPAWAPSAERLPRPSKPLRACASRASKPACCT